MRPVRLPVRGVFCGDQASRAEPAQVVELEGSRNAVTRARAFPEMNQSNCAGAGFRACLGLDSVEAMPTPFKIRAARLTDAGAVAALSLELGYSTGLAMVRASLRRILARDDHLVVVAESSEGTVCGWLQAHASDALESGFRVEIAGLVVSGATRRLGVGRALVARAEAWAAKVSAGTIVVRSNVKRVESHAFYPSLGYARYKAQEVYRKTLPR